MRPEQPTSREALAAPTDAELLIALSAGEIDALSTIYDRHAGLVYGLALKVLGNPQEAEDLTQDIFLMLARGCSYDPQRGSLRTFLAVLTRSRAIDRVRSRSRTLAFLARWKGSQAERASDPLLESVFQQEQSQEVQAAIAQLSEEQQQILKMAYYDGLSQSQIADRLNIPLGTAKARARRGLIQLRQTLAHLTR
ncbi:sigma-70 family RNA polymerase sigma factor [Leptolyngbya sp. FACHB-711]|uniref:sigma-70 family RNA polymerase sigma factor n=1 Tax=unclassified Leptolyngbya TaxID=2650499 RepID=UPI0016874574|nr:sigma-70 family RNA polymerase sigma factor [Leptolyngbya sp. FACHB-711]MBD1849375.1 sigma-70 family RNA polymerase sigma factor [Cyanobacteria bacterium FACHB-502]MBD2026231.1 sigma-70 family RNA polymerase sigma factor [Leptolyngbya sp. FACHB-711]